MTSSLVEEQYPAASAVDVPTNTRISVRLRTEFPVSSARFTLKQATTGAAVALAQEWVNGGENLIEYVWRPESALQPATRYTFLVERSQQALHQFSFTTGSGPDTTKPVLVGVSPEPESGTAMPMGPFRFTFSEPLIRVPRVTVVDGTGAAVSGGSDLLGTLADGRKTVEIRVVPQYRLPALVSVRIAPEQVLDGAANAREGEAIAATFVTTLAKQSGLPKLVGHYPEAGASEVPTNAMVQLLFDREMNYNSARQGGILLERNGVNVEMQAEMRGRLVRLTGVSLQPSTTYRVRLTGKLTDQSGLSMDAPAEFEFTTGMAPAAAAQPYVTQPSRQFDGPAPVNSLIVFRPSRPLTPMAALLLREIPPSQHGIPAISALRSVPEILEGGRLVVLRPEEPLPPWADISLDMSMIYDITGAQDTGISFQTSGERVEEPPRVVKTTPADGASNVPTSTAIRLTMDKTPGLRTPSRAVRLLRDGEPVGGALTLTPTGIDFKPEQALAPETDYTVAWEGVENLAGMAGEAGSIRFRTGAGSSFPAEQFRLTRNSLLDGPPGVWDPIEVEFNSPLRPAHSGATLRVVTPEELSSGVYYDQPLRVTVEGGLMRIQPVAGWPVGRDLALTVGAQDGWGRTVNWGATFQVQPGEAERPEVISIDPAPGTVLTASTVIRIGFSQPMLDASARTNSGAITFLAGQTNLAAALVWSEDRRSVSIRNGLRFTSAEQMNGTAALTLSSALKSVEGAGLRAVVYRYEIARAPAVSMRLPSITLVQPQGNGVLYPGATVVIRLSGPVPVEALDRALWVVTEDGRVEGNWDAMPAGLWVQFRPRAAWPHGRSVRLFVAEPVLESVYQLGLRTPPRPPTSLQVLRSSMEGASQFPANAVVDVEFTQEPPEGPVPVVVYQVNAGTREIPVAVSQPRPRVRRLTFQTAPAVGTKFRLASRPGSVLEGQYGAWSGDVTVSEALPANFATVRYLAPFPGSQNVPVNTRLSLVFGAQINALSVNDSTVRLRSGGRTIATRVMATQGPVGKLSIEPLELLVPGELAEVSVEGMEDRLGRAVERVTWSFRVGTEVDVTQPKQVVSNVPNPRTPRVFDPEGPLVVTFDEPLDPASLAPSLWPGTGTELSWELSRDLMTLTVRPPGSWRRGETNQVNFPATDLAGNRTSNGDASFSVAFEPDRSVPVLVASAPEDGQLNAPLNPAFALLFNQRVGANNVGELRLMKGGERVALEPLEVYEDPATPALYFQPVGALEPHTEYELIVEGVRTTSGTAMAGRTVIRFTTGEMFDLESPRVQIQAGAPDGPVRLRFSEAVTAVSRAVVKTPLTWSEPRGNTSITREEPVTMEWLAGTNELLLHPKSPLVSGRTYSVEVPSLRDLAGRAVGSLTRQFSVYGADTTSNVTATVSPGNGSTGVPTNALLEVRFSVTVQTPEVRLYQGDRLLYIKASQRSNAVSIYTPLRAETQYRIEFDSFLDNSYREVPGASSTFTTGAGSDVSPLIFLSSSPVSGATDVDPATAWKLNFNKPLAPAVYFDGYPRNSKGVAMRYTVDTAGQEMRIRPQPAWPAGVLVEQVINTYSRNGLPSVMDWAGNLMRTSVRINFRTAATADFERPRLVATTPESGAKVPGGFATVLLRFSEPVVQTSSAFQVYYGTQLSTTSAFSTNDPLELGLSLTPPENGRMTIVGTDGIRDLADNPVEPFVLEFDTGERAPTGRPVVELVEPRPGNEIAPLGTVMVRFDRVMDAASLQQAFRLTQDGQNTAGTVEVLEGGRAYRFRPSNPLPVKAIVRVFVLETARDAEGQAFVPYSGNPLWVMTVTEAAKAGAAAGLTLSRRGFGQTAPADAVLELEFSEELDAGSVDESSVWLGSGGRLVPGRAGVRGGNVLTFTPDAPLEPGVEYVLTAGAALRSREGAAFAGRGLRFLATDREAEAEVASVEEEEWGGGRALRVRFTTAVSPLAARGVRLERQGREVDCKRLASGDGMSVLLIPAAGDDGQGWTVAVEDVPARNGRMLRPRRFETVGKGVRR